jgi:hypothetical protein
MLSTVEAQRFGLIASFQRKVLLMSTGRFLSLCSHVLIGALAVPLLALAVRAQTTPAMPQYLFRVPVLPHTELFKSIPPFAELNTPVATIVEVFRTTDGRPLNTESVISFYRTALGTKGWKQGISNRQQDEPYLSMRTDLVETLPDRTQIQLAGDFYLWIAPACVSGLRQPEPCYLRRRTKPPRPIKPALSSTSDAGSGVVVGAEDVENVKLLVPEPSFGS